mmetsp:Transcript_40307/g.130389  ORF Transcript_40307/g.130389 Transcript_40307/m.130389 type:complete len:266 (+) Transcript_40307:137-934(+)
MPRSASVDRCVLSRQTELDQLGLVAADVALALPLDVGLVLVLVLLLLLRGGGAPRPTRRGMSASKERRSSSKRSVVRGDVRPRLRPAARPPHRAGPLAQARLVRLPRRVQRVRPRLLAQLALPQVPPLCDRGTQSRLGRRVLWRDALGLLLGRHHAPAQLLLLLRLAIPVAVVALGGGPAIRGAALDIAVVAVAVAATRGLRLAARRSGPPLGPWLFVTVRVVGLRGEELILECRRKAIRRSLGSGARRSRRGHAAVPGRSRGHG